MISFGQSFIALMSSNPRLMKSSSPEKHWYFLYLEPDWSPVFPLSGMVLLWLLGLLPNVGLAQTLNLPFDRIGVEDGLPNPSVLDLIQDSHGFLWMGTYSGIARYDGYEMKTYRAGYGDRDSIPNRDYPVLCQGREGRIWLGLLNQKCKLYQYRPEQDRFLPYQFDTLAERGLLPVESGVNSLFEDREGRLIVGTYDHGVFVITPAGTEGESPAVAQYTHDANDANSLISNAVSGQMSQDQNGYIWIPTESGLCSWNPETGHFTPLPGYSFGEGFENFITQAYFDPPHTLWAGTMNKGLLRIDTRTRSVQAYRADTASTHGLNFDYVSRIAKDNRGQLWVQSYGGIGFQNIQRLDISTGRFFDVRNRNKSFREGNISDLIVDKTGNIWVSAWQSGVFKFAPQSEHFQFLEFPSSGSNAAPPAVGDIEEDSRGKLWLVSYTNGLAEWDPRSGDYSKVIDISRFPVGTGKGRLYSIGEYAPGRLIVGNSAGGLLLNAAEGTLEQWGINDEASFSQVFPSDSGFWWGLNFDTGVYKIFPETRTWELVLYKNGLITIETGPGNSLFLGRNQSGLYHISEKGEVLAEHLTNYGIQDIHFDQDGIAWLSTHSSGLIGFDVNKKSLIRLPEKTHEAIGLCRQILEDDSGFLWINTARGIVQFDPFRCQVLNAYDASTWLQPGLTWYHPYSKGAKLRNGALAFGSGSGALLFHPDSLSVDTLSPEVVLTRLHINNQVATPGPGQPLQQELPYTDQIKLGHHQNDLSIHFSAVNYKPTEQNVYRYRLMPIEQDWETAGARNYAVYNELPAGHYTFEVQAASGDGAWRGAAATLSIQIAQPWWWTYGARVLYLLLAAGVVFLVARALQQRIEARRLREINALQSHLYTNITHEFRTPLTLILGLSDQLKSQLPSPVQQTLQLIRSNGEQLLRLVNQLLDLSRLDAGQVQLMPVQSDIMVFLKYVVASFEGLAREKAIELTFEGEPDSFFMDFDPGYLQQILDNLLSNAVKFTPRNGSITLRVLGDRRYLKVEVVDTGPGIALAEQEKIFNRFYQVRAAAAYSIQGTGIGLAVTRELVQLMGGTILVESGPESGSRFTVTLPVTQKAEIRQEVNLAPKLAPGASDESGNAPEATDIGNKQPTVLIVEDHKDLRQYLNYCLKSEYQVLEAGNGQAGLELAISEIPDIVVTDVMMPEMDGYAMCQALKENPLTSHIPVIMLTAKADAPSRLHGLELGAEAYLAKPFLQKELLIRVRKLLELRQQLKEFYEGLIEGRITVSPEDPEQAFLSDARSCVLEHIDVPAFGVEELARALAVSRTQLHRKLTQTTGHSAGRFIRDIRLSEAKKRLQQTNHPISEIAYQCGFNDPNYFARLFRQEEGMTPTEFRENTGK